MRQARLYGRNRRVARRGSARRLSPLTGGYDRDERRRRLRPDARGLSGSFSVGSSTYRSIRITGKMMIVAGPLRSVLPRQSS